MNADVLTTTVENAIAVITLGSAKRIYFDEEMGDSLTAALEELAGNPAVRVVVVTGGAPGPKRDGDTAGTGPSARAESVLETVHQRTRSRSNAIL